MSNAKYLRGYKVIDHRYWTIVGAPVKGLANRAIAQSLADYFNTSPSRIFLVSGFSSKQKVFEIK